MEISICIPSYHRAKVETLEYLHNCKVYVAPDEYEKYKKENPDAEIIKCADGVQGNIARVRNYILEQEFKKSYDAVALVDDDCSEVGYFVCNKEIKRVEYKKLEEQKIYNILLKYSQVCKDLGFYMWGMNSKPDLLSYRQCNPFSFSSFIGAPFQIFLKGNECKFDENIPLKEDYDMTIQQVNRYRGCLRCNFLYYRVKQAKQVGGCAMYRNNTSKKEQFELLQKKWGTKIVRKDNSSQKEFDFNPIIKIPIKGV